MILRDYETVAEEFFKELVEHGGNVLPKLFSELLTTRMFKSVKEIGVTVDSDIPRLLRGQISICDEYLAKLRMAWEAREVKASAEREAQFQKGGGQGS